MTVPTYRGNPYRQLTIVPIIGRIFVISFFIGMSLFAAFVANARPAPPSGGPRGGQAIGSGDFGRSVSGSLQRPRDLQKPNGGSWQKPNGQTAKSGNANGAAGGNRTAKVTNSGNSAGAAGNNSGNTGAVSSKSGNGNGNVNASNNGNTGVVNTGNVAVGNEVNVDVDTHGYGGGYYGGAAYATGVAVGATTSAIAMGTYYSTLPTGCASTYINGYRYYSCSGTWYQQTYKSGATTYVVVTDPTK